MAIHGGIAQKQQQNRNMSPEHIMGKAVLKMSVQELQQFVEEQIAENPAICMEEDGRCPNCGCIVSEGFCRSCLSEQIKPVENDFSQEWEDGIWVSSSQANDEYFEPFARVASPKSLSEYLKEQINYALKDKEKNIAEYLIDCLDEDGYLTEPLIDIAVRLGLSVPEVEAVLRVIQNLDPPGIGARDLRECMLLQLKQIEEDSAEKKLAEIIITNHWQNLQKMKLEKIAISLKIEYQAVISTLRFIRERLNPYPTSMFRDPWESLTPRRACETSPDIIVRQNETGFEVQVMDGLSGQLGIEESYTTLYAEINGKAKYNGNGTDHIRESVSQALSLIDALNFRKSTLRKIAEELIVSQADFLSEGPTALKPMTRKELAQRIGVHESTVCRATQDKTLRLPTGEVIPIEIMFDSALPVKELIRKLSVEQLSDGEIAEKLAQTGVHIARRTVAKYRSQLRLLTSEYRAA